MFFESATHIYQLLNSDQIINLNFQCGDFQTTACLFLLMSQIKQNIYINRHYMCTSIFLHLAHYTYTSIINVKYLGLGNHTFCRNRKEGVRGPDNGLTNVYPRIVAKLQL